MPSVVYLTVICTDSNSKTGTSVVEITVTVGILLRFFLFETSFDFARKSLNINSLPLLIGIMR